MNGTKRSARRPRTLTAVLWAVALLFLAGPTFAAGNDDSSRDDDEPTLRTSLVLVENGPNRPEPIRARGGLAWVFSDDLDFIGDIGLTVPFRLAGSQLYATVDSTTAIEKAGSDFTFIVRDLNYRAELGAVFPGSGRGRWSLFAGQQGQAHVDAAGHLFVRFFGGGWETGGRIGTGPASGWNLELDAGAILDDQGIDGDGLVRGSFRLLRPWRNLQVGFDFSLDGLFGSGDFKADYRGGPRIGFVLPGGRRADLFVHYLDGNNPLGLRLSGVLAGIDFLEAPAEGMTPVTLPDIDGFAGLTGGDGRIGGRMRMRVVSPSFAGNYRAVLEVDGNVLRSGDPAGATDRADELYYLYHVGMERQWRKFLAGAWFYHRSNHRLAEQNDTVTSINVLETGMETDRYGRGRTGAGFDWRIRGGVLLDSAFGQNDDWHIRGGVRYLFPAALGRWAPFARVELEAGDVERQNYRAGLLHPSGMETWLEYLDDRQFFSVDTAAFLAGFGYNF